MKRYLVPLFLTCSAAFAASTTLSQACGELATRVTKVKQVCEDYNGKLEDAQKTLEVAKKAGSFFSGGDKVKKAQDAVDKVNRVAEKCVDLLAKVEPVLALCAGGDVAPEVPPDVIASLEFIEGQGNATSPSSDVDAASAGKAGPITLADAIEMAKRSNSQIKAEKAKVEMAESAKDEAFSRYLPTVTLSASVTKINDPITIDLSSLQGPLGDIAGAAAYSKAYLATYNAAYAKAYNTAYEGAVQQMVAAGMPQSMAEEQAKTAVNAKMGDIWSGVVNSKDANDAAIQQAEKYGAAATDKIKNSEDFKMKVQDDVFFNARLTAIWPLFTGFKRSAAYDAAKENITAKKAAFDMAQNTVLMDVATKYFTLRLAEELTVMREATKKNLEEHLARSKKLEEGGQISKAERLRAEVALAEAENALEDSYRDQSLARMALASLLHTDTSLTAVTPVQVPGDIHSMEEFKQMALEKHPGLSQLRTERKRSQAAVSAAQGDYYPMVALFAYKELYTKDLTILEPEWAVGAKLQWDLFKGGETRSKVSNAKALDRSLGSMEEQTMDNIKLLVEKRWREKEHARSRLVSLAKTRELAEEAHRSQTLAYEAGLATGLDVVDAELALSRLQVAELKAHFDAVVAWLGLLEASGEVANAGEFMKSVKPVEPAPAEEPAKVAEPAKVTEPAEVAEAQAVQPPMAVPATEASNEPVPPAAPAEPVQPAAETPVQAQ